MLWLLLLQPVLILLIILTWVSFFIARKKLLEKFSKELDSATLDLNQRNKALAATYSLYEIILETLDIAKMAQRVASVIPQYLHYQTGVVALIDEEKKVLKRIAISKTKGGEAALAALEVPFYDIRIPLNYDANLCIRAMKEKKVLSTNSLYDVLTPAISQKNSILVQNLMRTKTTIVYPIYNKNRMLGVFLVSMNKDVTDLTSYEQEMLTRFTQGAGIALDIALLYQKMEQITQTLKDANSKLRELDHIKDEFVSVASHELRTPMTAIKSYLWMVLYKNMQPLDDKVHTYIFRAYDSTERLIRLVQDMLTVSRIEGKRMELRVSDFDLFELAKQIVDEIKVKAGEKGIMLTFTRKSENAVMHADRDKIAEVILNLLGNAVKYTPLNGFIDLSIVKKDTSIEISVKDTGPGISETDKQKLFQKFSRLEHSYTKMAETTGTGLGLYICRQIVSLHGGKIWVDSEVGKGSVFTFSIPQNSAQGGSYVG